MDPDIKDSIGDSLQVTNKRGRYLRDRLGRSHFTSTPSRGTWLERQKKDCFRCSRGVACKNIQTGKEFTSKGTGHTYFIQDFKNCCSKGVIYKATCRYGLKYVVKTRRESQGTI